MRRWICLAVTLFLVPVLSGCGANVLPYAREMGDMALLRTMAVDAGPGPDGVAVTVSTGKRAMGLQGEGQPPLILKAERESLSAACLSMQRLSENYVFYGYVDQLLVGETLAQRGIFPVLDYFSRDTELGLGAQFWLVRGEQAGTAVEAGGERGIDHRLSTMQTDSEMGTAGMTRTAGEVFSDLLEQGSAYLPALVVSQSEVEEEETILLSAGYGVFQEDKLLGYLEGESARGLELLLGQVGADILEVPLQSGQAVMRVTGAVPLYQPQVEDGQLTGLTITLQVTAELAEYRHTMTQEELERVRDALERREERRVRGALERLQQWGADCIGIGRYMGLSHPALWAKLEEQWPQVFSELPIEVVVAMSINRAYGEVARS